MKSNREAERAAFEKAWKKRNGVRGSSMFLRSDVWSAGGYEQPSVDYDWHLFRAGAEWQRRQARR
jgi:hypothetical protein